MTDKPKDNVKDIFTKKSLAEVEAEAIKDKESKEEYAKGVFQGILDGVSDLIEEGEVTGLLVAVTTKTGIVVPHFAYANNEAVLKMNCLLDLAKDTAKDECAAMFNLLDYEFLDE